MPKSMSDAYLKQRGLPPVVTPKMVKGVSEYRRATLEGEMEQGGFRESNLPTRYKNSAGMGITDGRFVTSSVNRYKIANTVSSSDGGTGGYRGSSGTTRQVPEIYSPLWLTSNLNLPRDRATINAWCRSFFALNPIVHNAINLHSTYPISKLNIKCKNQKVQDFFENMIEEIGLMNVCTQIAQEYWLLGEAVVYAEMNESAGKWSRILIQNPDYITIRRSVVAGDPIISLRPDENLKRIVMSNRPADQQQRQQLDPSVIEHVKRGENIPLSPLYASHIVRKIAPYETRGTGLVVSCFRQLMLFDKLRECHDQETEVLTNQGFKKLNEVIEYKQEMDGTYNIPYVSHSRVKNDIEIACFNKETDEIEYHKPTNHHLSYYNGEMYHFNGEKVDCMVTPNHDMLVKRKRQQNNKIFWQWEKEKASEVAKRKSLVRFKSCAKPLNGEMPSKINVCGKDVPIDLYLKFLGYLISDGCLYKNKDNYDSIIILSQSTSKYYESFKNCINSFADIFNVKTFEKIKKQSANSFSSDTSEIWEGRIHNKDLTNYFIEQIGTEKGTKSHFKRIPRWIMSLDHSLLEILLNALLDGDGTREYSKYNNDTKSFRYSTCSKQLADDVYEIVFKCGFSPNICVSKRDFKDRKVTEYIVTWSNTNYGNEPNVYPGLKRIGKGGGATVDSKQYNGLVWCFEVPTGLFITRRNHKVSIHGNSKFSQADNMINPLTLVKIGGGADNYKPTPADLEAWRTVFEDAQYDKDFKVFTHDAIAVERVGYNSGIIDIANDITQLLKEIYIGLMVPQVIMDGGSDVTYANGGVTLDVLRQRYMQFRNKLSDWLRTRIFAPISQINDFYEYKDGKKTLIVPEVEWNHMSLFDMGDYIQNLANLVQGEPPKLSLQTIYRSLGLDWEDEKRKMKMEAIQNAIAEKEKQSLMTMALNDLRALGPEDEIPEPIEEPLPGEEAGGGVPGETGGMGAPPPPGLPGMPPPPEGNEPGGPPPGPPPGEAAAPPSPPPTGEAGGGPPA